MAYSNVVKLKKIATYIKDMPIVDLKFTNNGFVS